MITKNFTNVCMPGGGQCCQLKKKITKNIM